MDGRKVTLKDVAQKAGLSVNTILRALKDKPEIARGTRERVKALAKEMGYVGNSPAGSLRSGVTKTIAVIVSDISNPHFGIMVKDIEQAARIHNYTIFVIGTEDDRDLEDQAIRSAIGKNVDGIILCPSQHDPETVRFIRRSGVPFVLIGRRFDGEPEFDYVVCDDERGGYLATRHLLENGHRRILFLNGPDRISSARERLAGYRRAYAEAGLAIEKNLVREVDVLTGHTRQIVKVVLERQTEFTAIFAFNDVIAWEAMHVLHRMGFRFPQDYAVIGFDNIQSRLHAPFPLSSVSTSKGKMSRRALDILLHKINQPGTAARFNEVMETKLILRESAGAVAGALNRKLAPTEQESGERES